ncbi:hypothetical protein BGX28_006660 [Mortierella sp. GBA30]|nr:hypothetical protein BGX28_006660 [Mortierella sp. GBA30]
MRFQNIVASVLIMAFASTSSFVAGQNTTIPAPTNPQACGTCMGLNINAIAACNKLNINPSQTTDPAKLNDVEKQCYCALVGDPTYVTKCSAADSCGADFTNAVVAELAPLKAQYCQAVSGKSDANSLTGSKTTVAIGAVAVVAAFAQALL